MCSFLHIRFVRLIIPKPSLVFYKSYFSLFFVVFFLLDLFYSDIANGNMHQNEWTPRESPPARSSQHSVEGGKCPRGHCCDTRTAWPDVSLLLALVWVPLRSCRDGQLDQLPLTQNCTLGMRAVGALPLCREFYSGHSLLPSSGRSFLAPLVQSWGSAALTYACFLCVLLFFTLM